MGIGLLGSAIGFGGFGKVNDSEGIFFALSFHQDGINFVKIASSYF